MIQHIRVNRKYVFVLLFSLLFVVNEVSAKTEVEKETVGKTPDHNSIELIETTKNAVAVETANLEDLKSRLSQQQQLQKAVSIEINAYNVQDIVHNNLLLASATSITTLERAYDDNRLVLKTVNDKIKDLTRRRDADVELLRKTQNQITLNVKQATEIKDSSWPNSDKVAMSAALRQLDLILAEKQRTLQNVVDGIDSVIKQFEAVKVSSSKLNEKIEAQIKTRKTQELFTRKQMLPQVFKKDAVTKELVVLANNLLKPFQKDFIIEEGRRVQETAAVSLLILVFLTTIAVVLVIQLRRFCHNYDKKNPVVVTHHWRLLSIKLLRRSLTLIGFLFVLFGYDIFIFSHYRFPFHQPVFNILLIFLFSGWLLDYLKFRQPSATLFIPEVVASKITRLTIWVRCFALVYVVIHLAVGEESFILFAGRIFIEIYLVACCIVFWRAIRNANRPLVQDHPASNVFSYTSLMFLSYLITLGGLAIELAGYPALALYWLLSWARSLAVLFWAIIMFKVIIEWRAEYLPATNISDAETSPPGYPIERIFVSLSWLLWFFGLIVALALAWNTRHNMFAGIYAMLNKSFSIGKVGLNSLDILFAVLILFLTLILTRLGRYIIARNVFVKSDLEPGFQNSITTISVYVMWGLGVILALSVLGVSTTSLAVVFGALGIGIGFGLQAIFNNFISGIILLFERPIQMGDDVEINGIWATVKKINVRATIVQTYDNASLIIPNSEFISSVVKNWSFGDKRLRRDIDVGVAYGSDVALVRRILLEIANKTPEIFKKPKPEVVFADFGDSALIFRLRIWTDIDNMIKVPTEIRFEIDRIFREQNIEIAFPQRDIHIRSKEGTTKFQIDRDLEK